jgi:molecular chaperone DnaK
VQQAVRRHFQREPSKGVHPEEVVALGAALQADALMQPSSQVLLLDVTPQSLGVAIAGGYDRILIPKNTTVPTSVTELFHTSRDGQTTVKIMVLQGESELAHQNELLGEFILSGLRLAPRGEVEIEVTFEISADGIVAVTAKDLETGQQQAITVTATSGLTEEEIRGMVEANKDYLMELRSSEEVERNKQQAEKIIDELEGLFPKVKDKVQGSDFGEDALKKARSVVNRARTAIDAKDLQGILDSTEALQRTLNMFKSVVSKIG